MILCVSCRLSIGGESRLFCVVSRRLGLFGVSCRLDVGRRGYIFRSTMNLMMIVGRMMITG